MINNNVKKMLLFVTFISMFVAFSNIQVPIHLFAPNYFCTIEAIGTGFPYRYNAPIILPVPPAHKTYSQNASYHPYYHKNHP